MILTRAQLGVAVMPPFFLGSLFALANNVKFNLTTFAWGFLILFLVDVAASYSNDYFDYEGDKHNRQFGFSGGSGVLMKHPEMLNFAKWGAIALFIISFVLTVLLVYFTFLPYWAIIYLTIGILFTWFYTAPPVKLAYRGFGEPPHFLAGVMYAGWGYLLITGTIDLNLIIFAIPLGLYLLTIILIFEIPDMEGDVLGEKHNFVVRKGRMNGFLLIMIIFWIVTFYFSILAVTGWLSNIINFWIISAIAFVPTIVSTITYLKKPIEKIIATKYAIRTAISLFLASFIIIFYFVYLVL